MKTLKLVLFHIFNAVLGIAAFAIVLTGSCVSVALLPLCCFGLVIFRILLALVGFLGELDVRCYNLIAPSDKHVYVNTIPRHPMGSSVAGERLSPTISSFSPGSLLALLYFATVKFAMGILSLVSISLVLGVFSSLLYPSTIVINDEGRVYSFQNDTLSFLLLEAVVLLVGVASMHIVAWVSTGVTRFVCCERFETYRYVQIGQYVPATVAYGSTGAYMTRV